MRVCAHHQAVAARAARGAALLLVVWLLVLLLGLIAAFAVTARTESLQGRFLARSTAASYLAEGGVELAVLRMSSNEPAKLWEPDGRPYAFTLDDAAVEVGGGVESGKVVQNAASPELLAALVQAVGGDSAQAARVGAAIQDFRDGDNLLSPGGGAEDPEYAADGRPYGAKDRNFEAVSELQQVLGVDHALFVKLAPHVTIYTGLAQPEARYASAPVLQALGLGPLQVEAMLARREPALPGAAPQLAAAGTGTYSISSRATRPDGTRAVVHATVRLGASGGLGQLYTPLSWRVGDPD
jgi:general secretion pathway protein K